MKCAVITGAGGQDASYLSEILLDKGYDVVGIMRRKSVKGDWRIKHIYDNPKYHLEYGDITDSGSIKDIIDRYNPSEFFNLAAQSFVGVSWKEPYHTSLVNSLGALNCLNAIRDKDCKFYQASTSELFGKVQESPQKETTPFYPRSPYGVSKIYSYWMVINYRESYKLHASNGLLFNHGSPRRGEEFVERKVTKAAARIKLGLQDKLFLGNLDSKRDWGHSKDYMEAAWLMLQQDKPDDYVIATGETHSIRDLLDVAFGHLDLDWQKYVEQDERFMRPAEVDILLGDASKAKEKLGWEPMYTFEALVKEMVDEDLRRESNGLRR